MESTSPIKNRESLRTPMESIHVHVSVSVSCSACWEREKWRESDDINID